MSNTASSLRKRRKPLLDRVLTVGIKHHANRVLSRMLSDAEQATATQDRLLLSLIRMNAASDYGREHGFASVRSYDDFVSRVKINDYADLSPWVERVRQGDVRAMFGGRQRVHMFAMTSGTVDQPKYVPVTDRFLQDIRAGWSAFGIKALRDHPECFTRPIVQVTSPMDEERSPAGYPCGAITGLMATTQKKLVQKYYVAPTTVALIPDRAARLYTIMRLAMIEDVSWMVTASPATMLQLAKTGDAHASSIIRDVRDGTLSADMPVPDNVRRALSPRLRADRDAARRLEQIHEQRGALLPKDYWNLGFLANWTGGTMGLHLREFPTYFGSVPVRDIGLIATEGRMSIPIEDGTPAGMAAVSQVFLEFIPADQREKTDPDVLRSHEVEVGGEYFVLLTTSAGFYRYDICDCVRVVGFQGQAPMIEFLHKGAHVSSITGEKITERQVVMAFECAAGEHSVTDSDFVLAPQWADPPFYRLYIETAENRPDGWARRFAGAVDEHLQKINIEYSSKRSSGRLGVMEPAVVQSGVFASLDAALATRFRQSNEQFKHKYLFATPGEDHALSEAATRMAADRGEQGSKTIPCG